MTPEQLDRNIEIFKEVALGATYVAVGEKYQITGPRVAQIVRKIVRKINGRNRNMAYYRPPRFIKQIRVDSDFFTYEAERLKRKMPSEEG